MARNLTRRNYLGIVVLKDIVSSDCYATDDLAHWNLKTKKINATNKGIRSGSFYLLGSPHRYNLSVTEQVTLLNSVAGSSLDSFLFDEEMIKSCVSFQRIKNSHGSISCTSSYIKSKKRINYYALLKREDFF